MSTPRLPIASALLLTAFAAAPASAQLDTRGQPVVYGSDDRVDVVAHPNAEWRAIATGSVGALVGKAAISTNGNVVSIAANTLQEQLDLCPDERFASQPAGAFCSGTLIAPNLFLTAGHCVQPTPGACTGMFVVMNYQAAQADSAALAPITRDDLFACRRVVAHALSDSGGTSLDYAIIELDRPATPRFTPAVVRAGGGAVDVGDGLVMIGSPSGIPTKIDDGGAVLDARAQTRDYFVGSTDSFAGNSGSGVWDRDALDLIGILVSGETDYVSSGGCDRVNVCGPGECSGENITYAFLAVGALCESYSNPDLCGDVSSCGDGHCASDETATSCASDCAGACGDRICERAEWDSCPGDCEVSVPAGWTCDPGWYGSFDGCDCSCGEYDPDCDIDPTCVTGGPGDLFCAVESPGRGPRLPGNLLLALGAVLGAGLGLRRRAVAPQ